MNFDSRANDFAGEVGASHEAKILPQSSPRIAEVGKKNKIQSKTGTGISQRSLRLNAFPLQHQTARVPNPESHHRPNRHIPGPGHSSEKADVEFAHKSAQHSYHRAILIC